MQLRQLEHYNLPNYRNVGIMLTTLLRAAWEMLFLEAILFLCSLFTVECLV